MIHGKCWKRERWQTKNVMESVFPGVNHDHILFDPDIKRGQYWRFQQTTHDGTAIFTIEAVQKLLLPLICRTSFYKGDPPNENRQDLIRYRVGWINHAVVYGRVLVSDDVELDGLKERFRIRVICEHGHDPK